MPRSERRHRPGFSPGPEVLAAADALRIYYSRITNAVKCLPPANKPMADEVRGCNGFLRIELERQAPGGVVIALGAIAHGAVLRATGLAPRAAVFAHGALHALPGARVLLDSYHCSRYNTQTRRLTAAMFDAVFARARVLLDGH